MVLPVITRGHATLKKCAREVGDASSPAIQKLIDDMIETMYEKDGIGLAANQVNSLVRIAVIVPNPERFEEHRTKQNEAIIAINPVITRRSIIKKVGEEGCLSVPGMIGLVRRHASITISFLDRAGIRRTLKARGLLARVFQHEIDHLDGILFIDKAEKIFKLAAF